MDELDELRKQKLAKLQQEQGEQEQLTKQIEQLEAGVRPHLTPEALLRYGALKSAHPEKAVKALVVVAQLISKGARQVDDAQLRDILMKLEPEQREMRIRRA